MDGWAQLDVRNFAHHRRLLVPPRSYWLSYHVDEDGTELSAHLTKSDSG
jgi:hypothetical protein